MTQKICFILSLFILSACTKREDKVSVDLTIYAHDSLLSKKGLLTEAIPLFELERKCKVSALSVGDAAQLPARLELDEKRKVYPAQILMGLDSLSFSSVAGHLIKDAKYLPDGFEFVVPELKDQLGFYPYDYGALTLIVDTDKIKAPHSIFELVDSKYKKKIIFEDPRTSTPGLQFVLYINSLLPEAKFKKFFKELSQNWLTLTPGWDEAYGLFLKEQAPLVWSYMSSQAYHEKHDAKKERFRAAVFKEGHPLQVEGMALIAKGISSEKELSLSKSFLDFILSKKIQSLVMTKNWMLPVRQDVELLPEFNHLPKSYKKIKPNFNQNINEILQTWRDSF